jgi:hypothetical protein
MPEETKEAGTAHIINLVYDPESPEFMQQG